VILRERDDNGRNLNVKDDYLQLIERRPLALIR
jgi:hypothetical protein